MGKLEQLITELQVYMDDSSEHCLDESKSLRLLYEAIECKLRCEPTAGPDEEEDG